ncbi:MAG: Hsp20/alpha crystallin family protein [bacterium]
MMSLTRWNPTRDLLNITDEMNRFVDSVFSQGGARETSLFKGTWNPAVDIAEDDDNFYLHMDLPGLKKEDVKVKYEEGMLTLTGEKKIVDEQKDINYHRVERSHGKFERSFRITSQILADKISADFSDGVLSVTLPKAEEIKPKEIEVKIK